MFRTFSPHCNQASIIALYKCQVLPILEYACVVWDPHLKRDQLLLESVQLFATRMAARSWTTDSESLNHHFQLPSLSYFKLLTTYKCLNSYTFCPLTCGLCSYEPSTAAHNGVNHGELLKSFQEVRAMHKRH